MEIIDPNEYYSASRIVKLKLLPFFKSIRPLTRAIGANPDLFLAIVSGDKHNRRYLVKGENLLVVLEKAEIGELLLDRAEKHDR